jgi:hypothetical protein
MFGPASDNEIFAIESDSELGPRRDGGGNDGPRAAQLPVAYSDEPTIRRKAV